MSAPSPAALACAREIFSHEPHHKYEEEHIFAAALIIDRHRLVMPLHGEVNTTDEVRDIRDPVRDIRNSEEPK